MREPLVPTLDRLPESVRGFELPAPFPVGQLIDEGPDWRGTLILRGVNRLSIAATPKEGSTR